MIQIVQNTGSPGVNDDASKGFYPGYFWLDDTVPGAYAVWQCMINTTGAAVWVLLPTGQLIPSGAVEFFAMQSSPSGWLECDGSAVSRTTYAALFAAITVQDAGNTTSASAVVTNLTDTSKMQVGDFISGSGIPAGTTIASVDSGTQITMSQNATATASGVPVVVSPWGIGDGSTTFNVPDLRGEFIRGWDHGRGIDSGRLLGSAQADDYKSHSHTIDSWDEANPGSSNSAGVDAAGGFHTVSTNASGGTETRPRNISMLPCIKT